MVSYAMMDLGLEGYKAVENALGVDLTDFTALHEKYTKATALSALKAFAANRAVKS
jgi:hypothetical protein